MICAQCGGRVRKGHSLCGNCGTPVGERLGPGQADHRKEMSEPTMKKPEGRAVGLPAPHTTSPRATCGPGSPSWVLLRGQASS
jgi:hypothetical protein